MEKIRNFAKKIRLYLNKFNSSSRKRKLKTTDFSIISNNCYAGIVYQYLGLPYNTPTVGLYFFPNDYLKFVKNFEYYIKLKLDFIDTCSSKHFDKLKEYGQENVIIGILDDVEIIFLHYTSKKEAYDKWTKRCSRLSKNIIFKFNDQNGCSLECLKEFDSLDCKHKICFTSKDTKLASNIFLKKFDKLAEIKEDYYTSHKYFDIIDYVNANFYKKKVLHIIPTYNFSGAERVAITIIKGLEEHFDFVYSSFVGTTKDVLEQNSITFLPINKMNIINVKKIVNKVNPDIIHAHDYTASCVIAFSTLKPIISHIHNNSPWIKKIHPFSFLYLFSSFRFKKILTVSDSIENEYIFSKFIKKKIINISNPVDTTEILNSVCENDFIKKYDICCVGRLMEQKNPFKFVDIISEVKKTIKDINVVWVGEGYMMDDVKEYVNYLGLSENIHFVGFQSNPYKYIAASKTFLLTSDWEGYGLVAFESLTLGVPAIVSNVGGLPDIVTPECGYLCNKFEDYMNVINLLNDKNLLIQYSIAARKRAMEIQNLDDYLKTIDSIYKEVC